MISKDSILLFSRTKFNFEYLKKIRLKYNCFCFSFRIPTYSIIRLLINCGADVNQICFRGYDRPLHLIAQCSDITIAKPVVELLLAAGAYPYAINVCHSIPYYSGRLPVVKELLRPSPIRSLKSQCAKILSLKTINYENYLPLPLVAFINFHVKPKINYSLWIEDFYDF